METDELTELAEATEKLRDHTKKLLADYDKPLRVNKEGFITSGMVWINGPFVNQFWPDRKPVKPKHACPECGAKHAIRKAA